MEALNLDTLGRTLRPELVRYAARLVGDTDAEDVVQIVLSKAADAISGFRGESSPRTWLYRITTNAARDWNRARRGPDRSIDVKESDSEDLGTEDALQDRRLVREEMSRCVGEVLRRLPESYQVVIALSDCEELSDREVAEVLEATLGAVKVRLHRARTRMKKELEEGCSFYYSPDNILCCDRKEQSTRLAYPSDHEPRQQVESRDFACSPPAPDEDPTMNAVETLPTKQKHLIGIGAAIAAGCEPCTKSFVGSTSAMEGGSESPGAAGAGACGCGSIESPRPT